MSDCAWLLKAQSTHDDVPLLQLYHWVKCLKDNAGNIKPADTGEYQFAKYNKKVRTGPSSSPQFVTASTVH